MAKTFICAGCGNKIRVNVPRRPTKCRCSRTAWFDMENPEEMKSYETIKERELDSQFDLAK